MSIPKPVRAGHPRLAASHPGIFINHGPRRVVRRIGLLSIPHRRRRPARFGDVIADIHQPPAGHLPHPLSPSTPSLRSQTKPAQPSPQPPWAISHPQKAPRVLRHFIHPKRPRSFTFCRPAIHSTRARRMGCRACSARRRQAIRHGKGHQIDRGHHNQPRSIPRRPASRVKPPGQQTAPRRAPDGTATSADQWCAAHPQSGHGKSPGSTTAATHATAAPVAARVTAFQKACQSAPIPPAHRQRQRQHRRASLPR